MTFHYQLNCDNIQCLYCSLNCTSWKVDNIDFFQIQIV